MMKINKVLLIRSPQYMSTFINESDNFLLTLVLPCIITTLKVIL